MKKNLLIIAVFILIATEASATDSLALSKRYYISAKQSLEAMLDNKETPSFERAIFYIENAYYDNILTPEDFKRILDWHQKYIEKIATSVSVPSQKVDYLYQIAQQSPEEYKRNTEAFRNNWAIYSYMTDTSVFADTNNIQFHLPYKYSTADPMGTLDWRNTQVLNLLYSKQGNCFALSALYKIFADRLHTDALLCTVPYHIYVSHKDENGTQYNIDLGSRSFPGLGSLTTFSYSTRDEIKSGIAPRELNTQQSLALCLVYLAKGYEYKFHSHDPFILQCAETALDYDSLNLNALLLKAEYLESNILQEQKSIGQLQSDQTFKIYEKLITHLYQLGYREMPIDMKNLLVNGWTKDTTLLYLQNHLITQKNETRKASLSWGLFDETHENKLQEQYYSTLFNPKTKKIIGFKTQQELYNDYNFDPVVFAWQIDPLAYKFPGESPYSAFGDNPVYNIDLGGKLKYPASKAASYKSTYPKLTLYLSSYFSQDVANSSNISNGLIEFGKFHNAQEISQATTWNSGPNIEFVDAPGGNKDAWGQYNDGTLYINTKVAKQYEDLMKQKGTDSKTKQAALLSFYRETLHELVHYANDKVAQTGDYLPDKEDCLHQNIQNEPGHAFDNKVFKECDQTIVLDPGCWSPQNMDNGCNIEDQNILIDKKVSTNNTKDLPTVPK